MTESPLVDSSFVVPVFSPGDDLIACLYKAMAFQTVVASSRVTVQQVQGRQGQSYSSTGQCTQPKRPRNAAWYKGDYRMIAEATGIGKNVVKRKLVFLADLEVPDGQAVPTNIPNNAAFQTKDLDTYDSDCDDISNAKAVLMANISNYGSDVISEVPHSETYLNDMENQGVHAMQDFEQPPAVDFTDNEIHSDSNIIPYSQYLQETQQENVQDTHLQAQQDSMILSVIEQMSEQMINHVNNWEKANKEQNNESVTAELERYKERVKTFEQRLNIDLSSREKMIDSQMDDMIKEKLALKEQVDSLEQNLSKQIKEKECLLQTFTVFKSESKEKEDKYMENEIDLEKKIKKLDNILFKVGQSAHIVHMLTKPQAFYDNIHKQALGYQNPFYLRKVQRIKPTLYDVDVPSELPKVSLVNASLKKLKFHLTQFDSVVKKRTTPSASENVNEIEQVKAKQPLDGDLDLACEYTTRIQELLVYVQDTCPNAITPRNKKNDRISQTPSRNKKNKVEAQPRKVNKMNRVVKPVCDVDVKQSVSNENSDILCATCNKSMFDGVHDKSLLDLMQNRNNYTKSAKKHKKQNV
ncbi:hypothetical protein Tco_0383255 [Tanacetum coccineum]